MSLRGLDIEEAVGGAFEYDKYVSTYLSKYVSK